MVTPVAMEPMLGYHPCSTGLLTSRREPAVGQCQTGSLTGAVASERVSEAPKEMCIRDRKRMWGLEDNQDVGSEAAIHSKSA